MPDVQGYSSSSMSKYAFFNFFALQSKNHGPQLRKAREEMDGDFTPQLRKGYSPSSNAISILQHSLLGAPLQFRSALQG